MTDADLRSMGISDPATALERLNELSGGGVTDDDVAPLISLLLTALRDCPDPDRAVNAFSRWFANVGGRFSHLQTLLRHPTALDIFCLVAGCSQYFADLIVRQPEYFEILANPGVRGGSKTAARLSRDLSSLVDACRLPELKRNALRRWKAREMLRIGVRDLIGLSDMPATAREFSNLADACVQKALEIARDTIPLAEGIAVPFAVIAMGKLGGRELNYSSNIDLMFVHADDLPLEITLANGRIFETEGYLRRLSEALIRTLADETENGHVFRVDMRLRPEGRFGPLTRSLSGFKAYYESWVEDWERQAMIRARFVAGDRELGETLLSLAQPYVYRPSVTSTFIDAIRENKRRIERKCAIEGQTWTNVKTGYGSIRDVEFTVQMLQLQHGGRFARLRSTNTLLAISHLRHLGFLSEADARILSEDYQWLRTLEHRLQLLHGFQTQTLPGLADTDERRKLARRMGYKSLERFESDLQMRRERIHAVLDRVFYGGRPETALSAADPLAQLLDTQDSPPGRDALTRYLVDAGYRDVSKALVALNMGMRGNEFGGMPPDTAPAFRRIAPRLLTLAARSADPDAALAGIESLALAIPNRAQLYASFEESPRTLERLVELAGASPPMMARLCKHQEWLESLIGPDEEPAVEQPEALTQRLRETFEARLLAERNDAPRLAAIARTFMREQLRIAALECWGIAETRDVMAALSALADATLVALITEAAGSVARAQTDPERALSALYRVTVVGLGKLGGAELGYASDWDVVLAYAPTRSRPDINSFELANALAEQLIAASKSFAIHGANVEIDLRLRPWGRKGALVNTLRAYYAYLIGSAETWERQAALKARWCAGDRRVGDRFVRLLHAAAFGRELAETKDIAIRDMKRRIETERLKPDQRYTDLKLGYGGLTDIEWLAQLLQLRNAGKHPNLRISNTSMALSALARAGLLDNAEADALQDTYTLLTRTRNAIWLRTGAGGDALPDSEIDRRAITRGLGYANGGAVTAADRLPEDLRSHMEEARRIFQLRFNR